MNGARAVEAARSQIEVRVAKVIVAPRKIKTRPRGKFEVRRVRGPRIVIKIPAGKVDLPLLNVDQPRIMERHKNRRPVRQAGLVEGQGAAPKDPGINDRVGT